MQKIGLAMALSLCSFVAAAAAVQEPSSSPPMVGRWEARDPSPPLARKFSKEYVARGEHCIVSVWRKGNGIRIVAIKTYAEDDTLRQIITIKGKKIWFRFVRQEHGLLTEIKGDRDWDIFAMEYSDAARALPPAVRRLFHGYYGLQ